MKILLMGTHFDGLDLPEKIEREPHAHIFRVHHFAAKQDKLGRPYCIVCRGMPQFYDLEEREVKIMPVLSDHYYNGHQTVYDGQYIVVEKDTTNMAKVVHCKKDKYDVYIGRPSMFGNPFSHRGGTLAQFQVETREEAISYYENYARATPYLMKAIKEELRGMILGCWCKPLDCHGDILMKIANED
jgi:Domain of unknown function (DUF4326)